MQAKLFLTTLFLLASAIGLGEYKKDPTILDKIEKRLMGKEEVIEEKVEEKLVENKACLNLTLFEPYLIEEGQVTLMPEENPSIVKIKKSILRWKYKESQGMWFECGRLLSPLEMEKRAFEWAHNIVRASKELSYDGRALGFDSLKYSAAIESGFDRCAIGRHTREWAISEKLIKRKKRTISYSEEDVLKIVKSRKWKRTHSVVDIGGYQMLYPRYYKGPVEDMLDLAKVSDIAAKQMVRWGSVAGTDKPEELWWGFTSRRIDSRRKVLKRFKRKL